MTKDRFLDSIKQTACMSKRVSIVWQAAIDQDDKDPRWQYVHGDHMEAQIQSFGQAFGVDIPRIVARKPRLSYEEQLAARIEQMKATLDQIKKPEWRADSEKRIAELEAELAKLRELGDTEW